MPSPTSEKSRLDTIKEYYRRASAGDPSVLDLFTDDFDFHYYKFGVGKGKAEFAEFHRRGAEFVETLGFDAETFRYIVAGDHVVVEGAEYGRTKSGVNFPDNRISHGLFCSVFTFDGELISRMYSYADPDLTSADAQTVAVFYREK